MSSKKMAPQPEKKDSMMQEETVPADSSEPSSSSGAMMNESGKMAANEITIEGSEFKFDKATLTVKKGQPVTVTLKNVGKMPHDFVIDELNVRTKQIKSGETDTVQFTSDKAGTYEYYCSVGKHRQMGMKGTITVTE